MSRVLAIANIKGGVGKTTTTANLAAALVERGRSVLAIDLDPQASLTFALGFRPDKSPQTICQVLNGLGSPIASIIQPTQERIDLAPASHDLTQVVQYLESTHASVTLFRAALETLRNCYDYVLIDCPANAGILTGMALTAADQILIPLIPDSLSLQALNWLLFIVNQVHDNWNPSLRVAGLLLTMYDPRTRHAREIIETVHRTYGSKIPFFNAVVRDSVHLSEAASAGKSIVGFAPDSQPALAYRALAEEIETGVRETPANELYFVLVRAYEALRQRKFLEAFAAFSRATEIDSKLSRAWVGRAECALAWDESVRSLARALELEPQMQDVRTRLEQRLNERIASAASPEIPEMMALSHFLETIALNVYAEQVFRRVTEIDAHHEEAWLGLARTTPNCRDAVACVRRCLEFNPNSPNAQAALVAANKRLQAEAETFVEQGTALLKDGRRVEAWDAFAKAIHLDPQNDRAWAGCARCTDDWRSRSNLASHALRINPENEQARLLYVAAQHSQSHPTPPRWLRLVRFLLPAGIAVAALTVAFISTVAR